MSTQPRRLMFTADDFGRSLGVNAAVEQACRAGVLTAASLMVGETAAADAVARARRLPRLRVGLHLVLTDGTPVLPPVQVPGLVDGAGRFRGPMAAEAVRFALSAPLRRQLGGEIRAQFERYASTGLPLDHVNAHKHFHLHPVVLGLILRIGREFGLRAVRVPADARGPVLLRPWLKLLRLRLRLAGVAANDAVAGLARTGRMTEAAVLEALAALEPGATELYFHPDLDGAGGLELAALVSPRVRRQVEALGVQCGGYADCVYRAY